MHDKHIMAVNLLYLIKRLKRNSQAIIDMKSTSKGDAECDIYQQGYIVAMTTMETEVKRLITESEDELTKMAESMGPITKFKDYVVDQYGDKQFYDINQNNKGEVNDDR